MKFNDIKTYIVDQLNNRMKLNLDKRDIYSEYIDEDQYRLMIYIPDAIDKNGSSGTTIDLEKSNSMSQIMIWGLEVNLGSISKKHIEDIFTFLEDHFLNTTYYRIYDQFDQILRSGWEPLETMLDQKTIDQWVSLYQTQMMEDKDSTHDKLYIHKVMVKHTYFGEVNTYVKDEQETFRLKT